MSDKGPSLTPEEIDQLLYDRAVYGMAISRLGEDGRMHRVPPKEWPEDVRPDFEALRRIWGRGGTKEGT